VELFVQAKSSPPEATHAGSEKNKLKRKKKKPAGGEKTLSPPAESEKKCF
jgi:hypothetical protein